jgi:hypothetical protein
LDGCRHGLSNEEKKNTSLSDNFELHIELADSRNIAAVLLRFFFRSKLNRNVTNVTSIGISKTHLFPTEVNMICRCE